MATKEMQWFLRVFSGSGFIVEMISRLLNGESAGMVRAKINDVVVEVGAWRCPDYQTAIQIADRLRSDNISFRILRRRGERGIAVEWPYWKRKMLKPKVFGFSKSVEKRLAIMKKTARKKAKKKR